MPSFLDKLSRAGESLSRKVKKAVNEKSANTPKLIELEKALQILEGPKPVDGRKLVHGTYNFDWLLKLTAEQYNQFTGDWSTSLQQSRSRTRAGSFARLSPTDRVALIQASDKQLESELQHIKYRYQKLAAENAPGAITKATKKIKDKVQEAEDLAAQNSVFGEYLTHYRLFEDQYARATLTGAQDEVERSVLLQGGVYKMLKAGWDMGKGIAKVVGGDLSSIKGVVTSGLKLLNQLGGLIAGIADLATGAEADFRSVTARLGLDKKFADAKRAYELKSRNSGTHFHESRNLAERVAWGPSELRAFSSFNQVDIAALDKALRQYRFWCKSWKADIKEIAADLKEPASMHELRARLAQWNEKLDKEPGNRDDHVVSVKAFVAQTKAEKIQRQELEKQLKTLEDKLTRFESYLNAEEEKYAELLATIGTSSSIADQQSASARVNAPFDIKKRLAGEAASRVGKLKPTRVTAAPAAALSPLQEAMQKRRAAIAPDDD